MLMESDVRPRKSLWDQFRGFAATPAHQALVVEKGRIARGGRTHERVVGGTALPAGPDMRERESDTLRRFRADPECRSSRILPRTQATHAALQSEYLQNRTERQLNGSG